MTKPSMSHVDEHSKMVIISAGDLCTAEAMIRFFVENNVDAALIALNDQLCNIDAPTDLCFHIPGDAEIDFPLIKEKPIACHALFKQNCNAYTLPYQKLPVNRPVTIRPYPRKMKR